MAETPEEEIERLIGIFEASDMQVLRVVTPTFELFLSRESADASASAVPPRAREASGETATADIEPAASAHLPAPARANGQLVDTTGHLVRAPMVGTVYRAPEPGKPPFVDLGGRVEAGDTVVIVESMKVFTSVAAGVAGVVEEIYVTNAQAVEFDEPLLRIAPDTGGAVPERAMTGGA